MTDPERAWPWWRAVALVAIVVTAAVVAEVVGVPDQAALQQQVTQAGAAAPVLFVAGYAAWSLLPAPKNVATIAAGAMFGMEIGALLAWSGAMIGAGLAFALARWLGRESVARLLRGRLGSVDAALGHRGFVAVVVARLVPIVPFTAVNYGAGVTAVSAPAYGWGTAVGMLPGTLAYAAVGAFGGTDPTGTGIAVTALMVLTLGGWLLARRLRRPGQGTPSSPGDVEV